MRLQKPFSFQQAVTDLFHISSCNNKTFLACLLLSAFSAQQVNYKSHTDNLYNSFINYKVNLILFTFSALKSTAQVQIPQWGMHPIHLTKKDLGSGAFKKLPVVFSDPTEQSFPFSWITKGTHGAQHSDFLLQPSHFLLSCSFADDYCSLAFARYMFIYIICDLQWL